MKSQSVEEAALTLARRVPFVYLSTNTPVGYPETRVVYNLLKHRASAIAAGPAALPEGFASWIGTNTSSAKTAQLRRDPRACLYFADTKTFEGLSITGRLKEVIDKKIRASVYTRSWDKYYPGGRDGGEFTLFQFVPDRGRYYHGLQVLTFDATKELG